MIAVLYDPATGAISQTLQSSLEAAEATAAAMDLAFLEVVDLRDDYDVTHHVVGGTLQPIEGTSNA